MIHLACDDGFAELVQDEALQSTLHRASTELRIVALVGDLVDGVVGDTQVYPTLQEHLMYTLNL